MESYKDSQDLERTILEFTSKDPMFNLHLSRECKELLRSVSHRKGLTMGTFIRYAILDAVKSLESEGNVIK